MATNKPVKATQPVIPLSTNKMNLQKDMDIKKIYQQQQRFSSFTQNSTSNGQKV